MVDEYTAELNSILSDVTDFEKTVEKLIKIDKRLDSDLQNLRTNRDFQYPPREIQEEVIANCSGYIKKLLKQEFAKAQKQAEDVSVKMIGTLNSLVDTTLVPITRVVRDGTVAVYLLQSCEDAFGDVELWFLAVDKARDTGLFGLRTGVEFQESWEQNRYELFQRSWENIYNKQGSTYRNTLALRLSFLSEKAPYWYFLEEGNQHLRDETTYTDPYPMYSAPRAVTKAEILAREYIDDQLAKLARGYNKPIRTAMDKIRGLRNKVSQILARAENINVSKLKELVGKQIVEQHRKIYKTIEDIPDEIYGTVVSEVLAGIQNKEKRIRSKVLPGSGRMRLVQITKELGIYLLVGLESL